MRPRYPIEGRKHSLKKGGKKKKRKNSKEEEIPLSKAKVLGTGISCRSGSSVWHPHQLAAGTGAQTAKYALRQGPMF